MILLDIIVGATVKDGLPTAEQILHKHFIPIDPFDNLQILEAMQSYSDQQNAELREKLRIETQKAKAFGNALDIATKDELALRERVKELEAALQHLVDWQNKEVKKHISFSETMANARRLLK